MDTDMPADTFFVRPKEEKSPFPQNDHLDFPDGTIVRALTRELFEEAVRAATLKE
jgi:hypothetical protein